MDINRWKGLEDKYNRILQAGYAFKKGTEHADHAEMDETKKIQVWNSYMKNWKKQGWSISKLNECENVTLRMGDLTKIYVMNSWCGCVNEQSDKN